MMSNNTKEEQFHRTIDVVIPVYKPGHEFTHLIDRLQKQNYPIHQIILMHTEDGNDLSWLCDRYDNITICKIKREEFDHGRTRNQGIMISEADIVLCMTQDAVPVDAELITHLVKALETEGVAVAYAQQLPTKDCKMIEQYTRSFNYPDKSRVKSLADLEELGIKTYFCSNVCAAYKKDRYLEQGGFEKKTIFNEDMIFAAKLIKSGYKVFYCGDAKVIHSHNYSNIQQFKRNFDLAVSQSEHHDIFEGIKSEKEGIRLIKQSIVFLLRTKHACLIPHLMLQSGMKYLGYCMGKYYKKLPLWMIRKFTMNPTYWGTK